MSANSLLWSLLEIVALVQTKETFFHFPSILSYFKIYFYFYFYKFEKAGSVQKLKRRKAKLEFLTIFIEVAGEFSKNWAYGAYKGRKGVLYKIFRCFIRSVTVLIHFLMQ